MNANREILDKFVSTDPYRSNLTTPWTIDEFTYATCGRTAVRVPGEIDIDEEEAAKSRPNITHHVFGKLNTSGGVWFPVSKIENPIIKVKCSDCLGTGNGYGQCAECLGEGEIECSECEHINECRTCGGTGQIRMPGKQCEHCSGTGFVDGYAREVNTPCAVVQGEFLARFQSLSDCEMHVPEKFDPLAIIAMRFNGGIGALMPWRAESARAAEVIHDKVIAV